MNDRYHYQLGITLREGRRRAFVRKVLDGEIVRPKRYEDLPQGPVVLSIKATPRAYELGVASADRRSLTVLATAETGAISVEEIGLKHGMCFTGAFIGMYATGNGRPSSAPADFDWFEYPGGRSR